MKAWRFIGIMGVMLLAACGREMPEQRQAQAVADEAHGVPLPGSTRMELAAADGRQYSLFVMTPAEKAPPAGWPVVYVLDGNKWFPIVGQQARTQGRRPDKGGVLPAIVVGIGYPDDEPSYPQRTHDFTPDVPQREALPAPEGQSWQSPGGADAFLDFIQQEVKPRIEREFKVDRAHQALFGHSLGGLLVLHAWLTRPDDYATFMAASPSVWWNKEYILEQARRVAEAKVAPNATLLISVGERELPEMVSGARNVYAALASSAGKPRVSLHVLDDEDHVSIVPVAFNRLLRAAFTPGEAELEFYRELYTPKAGDAQ